MAFINRHRHHETDGLVWGVEPICKVLQFAPSTYYCFMKRTSSRRKRRDEVLKGHITRVFAENRQVYGANKIWRQLNNEGIRVARCTIERLMRELGLVGARRGKVGIRTTVPDELCERPKDLVERKFEANAPNKLWVADITYVKTLQGWVYVAFVIDVFSRMVVGWKVDSSLHSSLALDALEMALHDRKFPRGCIHHNDRGVQYVSIKYADTLAENGLVASVGSRGDSYDNALAESFNGLYKWELINRQNEWLDAEQVEWETLHYVHWFNHQRIHGANDMCSPVEFEKHYHTQQISLATVGN